MNSLSKKLLLFLSFLLFLVLGVSGRSAFFQKEVSLETARVQIGEKVFTLEIAETQEARRLGLGNREELCPQCGMLFLFATPDKHAFWMKDMRFPLDIVWLSGQRVVDLRRSVEPGSQEVYSPGEPADRVLELPATAARELEVGETVEFLP